MMIAGVCFGYKFIDRSDGLAVKLPQGHIVGIDLVGLNDIALITGHKDIVRSSADFG
jgi:hypothetical protein